MIPDIIIIINIFAHQVERFRFSSEQFVQSGFRDDAGCCRAMLWCGLDTPDTGTDKGADNPSDAGAGRGSRPGRKKRNLSDRSQRMRVGGHGGAGDSEASSGYSSTGMKPTLQTVAEDGYMTPHLFVRKLAKESHTPEQLLEEDLARKRKKKMADRKSNLSKASGRDDLHVHSTGPQQFPSLPAARELGLSRDDTEVDYGAFYHPNDRDPHRMQREYDPLTYSVRMSVKKEMAKECQAWKP